MSDGLALYGPGIAMVLATVLALVVPERGQYVVPFGSAAVFALLLGATCHRVAFGRWL